MSEHALRVQGLTKGYPGFTLSDVSFAVPRGAIVGLVGENGAGKSTTLAACLGLLRPDGGEIELLGQPAGDDPALRSRVGVVFDGCVFPEALTARRLGRVFASVYPTWEAETYAALLTRLELPADKPVKALSKGMKMKLSIATALSHQAELLVMDEATSGLDPVIRDDILDLLLDFVQDAGHAALLSSHITSDLEKVADYIVFLHQGRVVFTLPKDELRYRYGILRCGQAAFEALEPGDMLACRRQPMAWDVLVPDREAAQRKYPGTVVDAATLEEVMLLYIKGEKP